MSTSRQVVFAKDAFPPLPVYSQAIVSGGKVYASGSIGLSSSEPGKLVEGGVQPQTRAALENIAKVLKAAGSGLEHIVKANVYLANLPRDFKPMNEIYLEFFPNDPPARTCIGVAALPLGADVEIECIADIPSS